MNETAIIITAIAGLVTAIGVPLAAIAKLGPFTKEFNKMLADQHKRAMDAKRSTTSHNTASNPSSSRDRLSRQVRTASFIMISLGLCVPLPVAFIPGPVTAPMLVLCSLCVGSLVFGMLMFITDSLSNHILMCASAILDSNLTIAQMLVRQVTPSKDQGKEEDRPTSGSS